MENCPSVRNRTQRTKIYPWKVGSNLVHNIYDYERCKTQLRPIIISVFISYAQFGADRKYGGSVRVFADASIDIAASSLW